MATKPFKKRKSVSRKLPGGDMRLGLAKHAKLIGEVVWAWNELHRAYAFAFANAVDKDRGFVGHAIWSALNNDSAQREILREVLIYTVSPALGARLNWAIKETVKLAPYRNDVVHGAMGWRLARTGTVPTFAYFGNSFNRMVRYVAREKDDGEILEGPNLERLMALLRGDLMQLAGYVSELSRLIVAAKPLPSPRKPRLQAHKFAQRPGLQFHPKTRQGRRTRPKPSPG